MIQKPLLGVEVGKSSKVFVCFVGICELRLSLRLLDMTRNAPQF
jgi:hypothetical protein